MLENPGEVQLTLLTTGHPIIIGLSVLLLFGQVACAARPLSAPGAYTGASTAGSEQKRHKSAGGQSEGIWREKAARTPTQQKISSRLLYALKMRQGKASGGEGLRQRSSVKVDADGTTIVDIKAQVTEGVLAQIEALGGTIISRFPQYQAIRARLPLGQIEALAEMPEVIFIRPAERAITN